MQDTRETEAHKAPQKYYKKTPTSSQVESGQETESKEPGHWFVLPRAGAEGSGLAPILADVFISDQESGGAERGNTGVSREQRD